MCLKLAKRQQQNWHVHPLQLLGAHVGLVGLANLLPVCNRGLWLALLLHPPPFANRHPVDVRAWQLCNEVTVGVNQQQGFACAVPMALTKECHNCTTFASLCQRLHSQMSSQRIHQLCLSVSIQWQPASDQPRQLCCGNIIVRIVLQEGKVKPQFKDPLSTPPGNSSSIFVHVNSHGSQQHMPIALESLRHGLVIQQTHLSVGAWPSQGGGAHSRFTKPNQMHKNK